MARIFISYKHVDKEKVFKIKNQINEKLGEDCWIDLDNIESDAQFINVITKAINECEIVLFMYSKAHSSIDDFENDWTIRELNYASKKKKRIIFVNLDHTKLTDVFEFMYSTKQQVDATSDTALNKLFLDLKHWLDNQFLKETKGKTKLFACTNLQCEEFGKRTLPIDSKFCPSCGYKIGTKDGQVSNNKQGSFDDKEFTVGGITSKMIAVEGGIFWMGAQCKNPLGQNYDCDAWDNESPEHSVCVDDFYIAKNQVTQELWRAVMGDCPSHNKGEKFPVENVSWYDCQNFILKLNEITGMEFRLPTEAEWEYAAKGGIKSRGFKFSGDDDIDKVGWFCNNSGDEKLFDDSCGLKSNEILKLNNCKPHPVGLKLKNELGIYDMSGNVYEWCQDIYDSYGSKLINYCPETMAQKYYVCRGGSWCSYPRNCRVTSRHSATPDHKDYDIGFRLALSKKVK